MWPYGFRIGWMAEVKAREHLGERRHHGTKAKVRFEENKSKVRFLEKVSAPPRPPNLRPKTRDCANILTYIWYGVQLSKAISLIEEDARLSKERSVF